MLEQVYKVKWGSTKMSGRKDPGGAVGTKAWEVLGGCWLKSANMGKQSGANRSRVLQ